MDLFRNFGGFAHEIWPALVLVFVFGGAAGWYFAKKVAETDPDASGDNGQTVDLSTGE